jgi:hypothetical protein
LLALGLLLLEIALDAIHVRRESSSKLGEFVRLPRLLCGMHKMGKCGSVVQVLTQFVVVRPGRLSNALPLSRRLGLLCR